MSTSARVRARRAGLAPLLLVLALWTFTTVQPWWRTPATTLVNLGSLAALAGTVLLLEAVWLTSRYPRWEREVGLGTMLRWHRRVASAGVVLVTLHVVLTVGGLAGREQHHVVPEAWAIVLTWPDMLAAAAGLALLWCVSLVSVRLARRRMKYEVWWAVHLYSYLALVLSLFHQLSSGAAFGPEAWRGSVAGAVLGEDGRAVLAACTRLLWIAALTLTLCTVLLYRLVVPALRSRRFGLRVERVEPLEGGAVRLALAGRRLQSLPVVGGQFAQFRFGERGLRWQAHPYSFSGLPDRSRLYLTVGGQGDHARAVATLAPGTKVFFEGPYGTLTAAAAGTSSGTVRPVAVFVGGLGITPVCSLLRDLPPESRPVVVYRVRRPQEALYLRELRRLTAERRGRLHLLAGSRELHPLTPEQLEAWIPDIAGRHVYVCGSAVFVEGTRRVLRQLGVPRQRLTTEAFTW